MSKNEVEETPQRLKAFVEQNLSERSFNLNNMFKRFLKAPVSSEGTKQSISYLLRLNHYINLT